MPGDHKRQAETQKWLQTLTRITKKYKVRPKIGSWNRKKKKMLGEKLANLNKSEVYLMI